MNPLFVHPKPIHTGLTFDKVFGSYVVNVDALLVPTS